MHFILDIVRELKIGAIAVAIMATVWVFSWAAKLEEEVRQTKSLPALARKTAPNQDALGAIDMDDSR
jgi:hypothetical protein